MQNSKEELNFNQLILRIKIGKFDNCKTHHKIIFLSKGILTIDKNNIIFYDFQKYSKRFVGFINEEDEGDIEISKLLNDKFCIYTPKETLIYQFNNENFTITLLSRININLFNLKEMEENLYINTRSYYIYVWKKLKPIFRVNKSTPLIIGFLVFITVFVSNNCGSNIINFFLFFITIIISFDIHKKYIYLLNPYKRLKKNYIYYFFKYGKDSCLIFTDKNIELFNYKKYKKIKDISSSELNPLTWNIFIINEKILFNNNINKILKIYDINKNKYINSFSIGFDISTRNTFKAKNNIYFTVNKEEIIKWKYNFEFDILEVLNRRKYENSSNDYKYLEIYIKDSTLFILKRKDIVNSKESYIFLDIYK